MSCENQVLPDGKFFQFSEGQALGDQGQEVDWKRDRISLEVYRVYDRSALCRLPESLNPGSYRLFIGSSIDRSRPLAAYSKTLDVFTSPDHSQTEKSVLKA